MNFYPALIESHPDGSGDLNAIINGNWQSLANWIQPASGNTASQSGTTVTAIDDVFSSDDVGASIRYADGTVRTITAYTSPKIVEVAETGAIGSQEFELYRTTLETRDALMRGLTKQTRMLADDDGFFFYWDHTNKRLVRGSLALDTVGNITFGAPSGAQGSRIVARGEHTSEPAGALTPGQWELTVFDDGVLPVFSIRYNDGGTLVGAEIPLGPIASS